MKDNKFHFAREIIFNLRTCYAITHEVYIHWMDKLIREEKECLENFMNEHGLDENDMINDNGLTPNFDKRPR